MVLMSIAYDFKVDDGTHTFEQKQRIYLPQSRLSQHEDKIVCGGALIGFLPLGDGNL